VVCTISILSLISTANDKRTCASKISIRLYYCNLTSSPWASRNFCANSSNDAWFPNMVHSLPTVAIGNKLRAAKVIAHKYCRNAKLKKQRNEGRFGFSREQWQWSSVVNVQLLLNSIVLLNDGRLLNHFPNATAIPKPRKVRPWVLTSHPRHNTILSQKLGAWKNASSMSRYAAVTVVQTLGMPAFPHNNLVPAWIPMKSGLYLIFRPALSTKCSLWQKGNINKLVWFCWFSWSSVLKGDINEVVTGAWGNGSTTSKVPVKFQHPLSASNEVWDITWRFERRWH
jgi:hypothetical protein